MWSQLYDPFNNIVLSALAAAIPVVVLLGAIALFEVKAHVAAIIGLVVALAVVIVPFGMPPAMAFSAAGYGACFGLLPIGWIILNVIFLYNLTNDRGLFDVLRESISSVSTDPRMQLLFIAFCLGAFFEGAAGFGTPVAVTAAMLIGLGFSPLSASGLSLIANTAPVAFGALGSPVIALAAVTGLDIHELSGMIGRQLPFFSVIVPFWLIWAFAGFRGMLAVWPAVLVAGVSFAVPQYLVSNYHGPWLVDVVAAVVSMAVLALFLRVWQPAHPMSMADVNGTQKTAASSGTSQPQSMLVRAWVPWLILSVCVFAWGIPQMKALLDSIWVMKIPVPGLHEQIMKVPPVVATAHTEAAIYNLNLLSATG
ncbi:MAG: L-lactate permease, partial [Hyphomicrobium sp.]